MPPSMPIFLRMPVTDVEQSHYVAAYAVEVGEEATRWCIVA